MESRVHSLDCLRGPWDGRDREGVSLVRLRMLEASRVDRASHEKENFSRACSGRVPCCHDSPKLLASHRGSSPVTCLLSPARLLCLSLVWSKFTSIHPSHSRHLTYVFFLHDNHLCLTTYYEYSNYTMGFFQKFLSFGSRSKKRRAALSTETRSKLPSSREDARRQQEEQEEVANRLLRSSSLRYAVFNEVDYSSLPPLREYRWSVNKITSNSLWIRVSSPPSEQPRSKNGGSREPFCEYTVTSDVHRHNSRQEG